MRILFIISIRAMVYILYYSSTTLFIVLDSSMHNMNITRVYSMHVHTTTSQLVCILPACSSMHSSIHTTVVVSIPTRICILSVHTSYAQQQQYIHSIDAMHTVAPVVCILHTYIHTIYEWQYAYLLLRARIMYFLYQKSMRNSSTSTCNTLVVLVQQAYCTVVLCTSSSTLRVVVEVLSMDTTYYTTCTVGSTGWSAQKFVLS